MLPLVAILLACTGAPAPEAGSAPDAPSEQPAASEQPVAPEGPATDGGEAEAPPPGRIGGVPILRDPVVMGGIAADAVEAGIAAQREAIDRCYEAQRAENAALAGKVLVKFTIGPDGAVASTTTRSTSLRHPPTEACVNERIAEAKFPPLASGRLAIVHYPFAFPP